MLDGPDEDGEGVLSEKSPYEPDEFDPSSLGPDVPEAPSAPDGAANSEVAGLFWKLVVVFNIALLGLSVGPMLAYFEGQVDLGLRITALGALLFGYGLFRYRRFVRDRDSEAPEEDESTAADGDQPKSTEMDGNESESTVSDGDAAPDTDESTVEPGRTTDHNG